MLQDDDEEIAKSLRLTANDFGIEIEASVQIARQHNLHIYELGITYYGRTARVSFNQRSANTFKRVDHKGLKKALSRSAFWSNVTVWEQPTLAPSAPMGHQRKRRALP